MSVLGNNNFIDDVEEVVEEGYTIPAVIKKDVESMDFKKALVLSSILHPLSVGAIWMGILILSFLGINFVMFNKPDMKPKKDIEFVLVDREAMPRDPKTKNRSDMNSRAGGKNDPKKPVSIPKPASQAQKPQPSSSLNKVIEKQQKQIQAQQKQVVKQQPVQPKPQPKPQVAKPAPAKPTPPTVAPSVAPVSAPPVVELKPTTPFSVPIPSNLPVAKSLATGPVGGTSSPSVAKSGASSSQSGGSNSAKYAPAPSLAPSASSGGSQLSKGSSGSAGNAGNPQGGGGTPGIDAIKEPDFGPYMRELQRRIKLNWNPPKGDESKRVVLLFKIAKSGRLLSATIFKSSGLPSADQAALKAVELTAPFRPLPADFKGESIDIQFTFDYNVFGANKY